MLHSQCTAVSATFEAPAGVVPAKIARQKGNVKRLRLSGGEGYNMTQKIFAHFSILRYSRERRYF